MSNSQKKTFFTCFFISLDPDEPEISLSSSYLKFKLMEKVKLDHPCASPKYANYKQELVLKKDPEQCFQLNKRGTIQNRVISLYRYYFSKHIETSSIIYFT